MRRGKALEVLGFVADFAGVNLEDVVDLAAKKAEAFVTVLSLTLSIRAMAVGDMPRRCSARAVCAMA